MSKKMNKGMYSSNRPDWGTPQEFFDMLNKHFHFHVDVCASILNRKCAYYFDELDNGLECNWTGHPTWEKNPVCFCNPPYGTVISQWVKKAYEESLKGCTVVCLLPARVDTKWFHDYCFRYGEVIFVKGRLKFTGGNSRNDAAPFPSALVIFGGKKETNYKTISNKAEVFPAI